VLFQAVVETVPLDFAFAGRSLAVIISIQNTFAKTPDLIVASGPNFSIVNTSDNNNALL
jgi:hypothetical protein